MTGRDFLEQEWTNSHQKHTIHWKTMLTHLWMIPSWVDVGFHFGKLSCKNYVVCGVWISVEKERIFSKFDNFNISCPIFFRLFFYPGKNQFWITYVGVSSLSFQATFGLRIKKHFCCVYVNGVCLYFCTMLGHKFCTCAFENGLWISVEKEIIYCKFSNIQEWQYFLDHFLYFEFRIFVWKTKLWGNKKH
jgi:hypothetical protein